MVVTREEPPYVMIRWPCTDFNIIIIIVVFIITIEKGRHMLWWVNHVQISTLCSLLFAIMISKCSSAVTTVLATADSVVLQSIFSPPSARWAKFFFNSDIVVVLLPQVSIVVFMQVADFTFTLYRVPDNIYGVFDHQTKVQSLTVSR